MSKIKGVMPVEKATLLAWNDVCEQCRINGSKEVVHMNIFVSRVRAYVMGRVENYRPLDGNITRRLRELKAKGLINYEYKDEVYYVKKAINGTISA
jgi:hypothetical protein